MIGVVVEVLSLVPSLFLVQFFRRIRVKVDQKEQNKDKRCSIRFPWWCLYVAYGLSVVMVAVSMFFIIARGIMLGDRRIQQWLKSLVISFISSVFFTQPLKVCVLKRRSKIRVACLEPIQISVQVLSLTIVFLLVCSRHRDEEADDDEYLQLSFNDRRSLHLARDRHYLDTIQVSRPSRG